jgi:hypothetical protein
MIEPKTPWVKLGNEEYHVKCVKKKLDELKPKRGKG